MNQYDDKLSQNPGALPPEAETLPKPVVGSATLKTRFDWKRLIRRGPTTKREKAIFAGIVAVIILIGAGILWWVNNRELPNVVTYGDVKKPEKKWYSPLSGIEVADEAATKRAVTAVMIENSPDARPQSGLAEADVVFEAVAEGGITRFIALYQQGQPGIVGPVRSLRPYYADWAAGFDPSVAHVGGSPEALTMIRSGNYGVDIDQFFNAGSYWRASDRAAPHNVYTNFEKLNSLNTSKNKTTSTFTFVPRKDEKKVATPNASTIIIPVSSGLFSVDYTYDAATNTYIRKQGGEAHVDREKGQIAPKVVVALKTSVTLSDDGSHMTIAATGSGAAYVFQNGTVVEGTWSKADPKSPLVLKGADGEDISLVRGQTWITVVGNEKTISWQ